MFYELFVEYLGDMFNEINLSTILYRYFMSNKQEEYINDLFERVHSILKTTNSDSKSSKFSISKFNKLYFYFHNEEFSAACFYYDYKINEIIIETNSEKFLFVNTKNSNLCKTIDGENLFVYTTNNNLCDIDYSDGTSSQIYLNEIIKEKMQSMVWCEKT